MGGSIEGPATGARSKYQVARCLTPIDRCQLPVRRPWDSEGWAPQPTTIHKQRTVWIGESLPSMAVPNFARVLGEGPLRQHTRDLGLKEEEGRRISNGMERTID